MFKKYKAKAKKKQRELQVVAQGSFLSYFGGYKTEREKGDDEEEKQQQQKPGL